ncbi:MAG: fused MFS/spermidine synthase [Candidatus Sabulitectum sp.]|nr:fused MFS/spermidine synthase [Candidatus Sabulitectum sp.]
MVNKKIRMMNFSLFSLLSGIGILLAQIAWNRQLLLITGGSIDATAVVLSAFMLGLGFGGRFFGRKAELSTDPVSILRLTAGGAAICSFVPLLIAPLAVHLYPTLYSSGLQLPARFVVAVLMIFPATFFAGGIVPVMARLVEGNGGTARVSRLYGLNSLGSAIGGFLAGFILLEAVGIIFTLIIGAALTTASLLLVKPVKSQVKSSVEPESGSKPGLFFLWMYFSSGMLALSWEMVWSRQLTFVLGNSTYAFATMGIMVLLGIGIGSIAGRRLKGNPLFSFGVVQVLLGTASVLPLTALGGFISLSRKLNILSGWAGSISGDISAAMVYMLPSTILMGITFPLMVKAAAREQKLGEDVGILSMANCLGAALGPILASQILFRFLGVTPSVLLLAVLNASLGFFAFWRSRKLLFSLLAPAGAVVSLLLVLGARAPGSKSPAGMDLTYFQEGRTATVAVFGRDWDHHRSLRINGVEEVPVDQASLEAFYLLGHLPWGYNPDARTAMAVAMGGGITSGALLTHPIDTLVCAEICPEVVLAAVHFERQNNRPDLDPRFELIGDDGRNFLLGANRKYDLIVCDATHPGSSESWLLYTEEYYLLVLSRLEPGGVAAQWVPLHRLPVEEFSRIIATWSRVFPFVAVHPAGGRHAILIGSAEPLQLDIAAIFRDSIAAEQLNGTGFREDEPLFLKPLLSGNELLPLKESPIRSNTDDLAPCQFLIRKCQGDPQQTIGENMSLMLSLDTDGDADPVHTGQVIYWNMMLPQAAEYFRNEATPTAMSRRWLSVALSTAAELLYNEGRYREALDLADMAWQADPGWQRNIDLVIEINRAQSYAQEEL